MKHVVVFLVRVVLLAFICFIFWLVQNESFSNVINLSIIVGGVLLTFQLVWLGRKMLDKQPTMSRAIWVTTFVHFGLSFTLGAPFVRAVTTYEDWSGWLLPVPSGIGLVLGLTIMLEVGDIKRFPKVGDYSSYCRCVESKRITNKKKKRPRN